MRFEDVEIERDGGVLALRREMERGLAPAAAQNRMVSAGT